MDVRPIFDHIAFNVPNLNEQIDRMASEFGFVIESRSDRFAIVSDPATGLKFELGRSEDRDVHFRHLGFRTADVDNAHEALVAVGMEVIKGPHRQEFARMYTSYLEQPGGLEVQLVKYD